MQIHFPKGAPEIRLDKTDRRHLSRALDLVRKLAEHGKDSLADDALGPLELLVAKYDVNEAQG